MVPRPPGPRTLGHMPLTVAFAIALAEARSCLAALADTATSFDESSHYEHLLLDLDAMHEANLPAHYPLTGNEPRSCDGSRSLSTECSVLAVATGSDSNCFWPRPSIETTTTSA